MRKIIPLVLLLLGICGVVMGSPPVRSFSYVAGAVIQPTEVTKNEDNIFQYLTAGVDTLANNAVTTSKILDGTIVNADINGAAAIAGSKLGTLGTIVAGAGIIPDVNLEAVPWTDYTATSVITGWSAFTANKFIRYKRMGKTVFVAFWLEGTSNSVQVRFTLPYPADNVGVNYGGALTRAGDNGGSITTACGMILAPTGATVECFTDMYTAPWTNAFGKNVQGQFWYVTP
ncbi:MAG: hypothetical protein V1709_08815 [Planctomycetota bacterium]